MLQAKRGSHIVITTIMFNFIAASLVGYLINYWFRPVGKMAVESREITGAYIMSFREVAREFFGGVPSPPSPLNFSVFLAIVVAFAVWYLLWCAPSLATESARSAPTPAPPSIRHQA